MEESKAVVFHDGFRFDAWFNFMTEPEYKNVVLDAHWYLGMDLGSNLEELDFMRTIFHDHAEKLKLMEQSSHTASWASPTSRKNSSSCRGVRSRLDWES